MAKQYKRFSITATEAMKAELQKEKDGAFSEDTQNEMLRKLIDRGLSRARVEKEPNENTSCPVQE